ncbi:MAG: asparagine synthase (glutamine-hydrolyzing) [Clostridia bacterium]|nr:asparagine synthase (glutamine-hydrolyzing) [Clostridia bacterium]
MCSIAGILNMRSMREVSAEEMRRMGETMKHRGPDQSGACFFAGGAFQQNRLAVMDVENGKQPMSAEWAGKRYTIVYNGEVYNTEELRAGLAVAGADFKTRCDTEVVLWSYILYGEQSPSMLNGIFAYAILEEDLADRPSEPKKSTDRKKDAVRGSRVFLARDRFGIKPLYYTEAGGVFRFASEVKALLASPDVSHTIDSLGLWQLFYLSPVTLPGKTVFRDIYALLPGEAAYYDENGLRCFRYWSLHAKKFEGTREEAIGMTGALVRDAVRRQLVSDVPLCVFLSGGLDSSVVAAVASEHERENGRILSTYSFEYEGNKENFRSTMFQPQGDDEYAVRLALQLGTDHMVLTAPTERVGALLSDAVRARDLPGQADIDSSLLYFCSKVKELHTVALSGECSDEIFGGYPWFYRPEMLERDFFPWLHEPMARISLLRPEIARAEEGYHVLSEYYKASVKETPVLDGESAEMRRSRIATWLSVNYFMANLLERKDRMSMYSGLEVRVPFGDHRILEFVYNVPWQYKMENGHEKSLLREAMRSYLPEEILWRKKSPYPKTHNPAYEALVQDLLRSRLAEKNSPLGELIDKSRLSALLCEGDVTWFGQLMSRPQLYAWLYQFDVFCETYGVTFAL